MAFPFFWMISTALQTLKETLAVPLTLWPETLQWSNFTEVFKTINAADILEKYDTNPNQIDFVYKALAEAGIQIIDEDARDKELFEACKKTLEKSKVFLVFYDLY